MRPLFPQLNLEDALKFYNLEALVRDALLKRIRTVTDRESPKIEIEMEQGTIHAGFLRSADTVGAGAVVVGGKGDHEGRHLLSGSAEHFVRHANCPVPVTRPSPAERYWPRQAFPTQHSQPSKPV